MIKKVFSFVSIVFLYLIVNSLSFSWLPFSEEFKSQNMSNGLSSILFVLASICWIIFTIIYIINNSKVKGIKLIISTIVVIFMAGTLLTQLETLFFNKAFKGLIKRYIMMIILAGLIPIIISVIAGVLLFRRKNDFNDVDNSFYAAIDMKKSILNVLIIGAVYVVIYFTFGYFVAWQLSCFIQILP